MILKSFELNKLKLENYNFYLFYGDNEGLKEDTIKSFFVKKYQNKIHRYEEKEILDNIDDFYNNIFTKSFFDKEKLIVINRVSDKIREIIEELIEKKTEDIQFILNSKNLEKKSTLRKPNIGMFLKANKIWKVDKKNSFMIGDQLTDMQFAKKAGIKGHLFDQTNLYKFIRKIIF